MGLKLKIEKTPIEGVFLGKTNPFIDHRGEFMRLYDYVEIGSTLNKPIKEINLSKNNFRGTVRGMHYEKHQEPTFKIIKCVKGAIIDNVLDIRKDSKSFMSSFTVKLYEGDNQLLFIPNKVAHGFQTLLDNSNILYFHTDEYNAELEDGLNIKDPKLNLSWSLPISCISDRDKNFPYLKTDFYGI